MSKIEELKQAVEKLEVCVTALVDAERDRSNWEDHDLSRRDGSSAQDARHEEMGRTASMRVNEARREVEAQKSVVAALSKVI